MECTTKMEKSSEAFISTLTMDCNASKPHFFVTNLGKDRIILGYPWFEAFNPKIDWKEGRLLGPRMELKTTGAINQEHVNQAYEIRRLAMEIRKTTITQKMAEAFQTDKPKKDILIPLEYQRHTKVFSE
jgi:hypothetical protein